MQIEVKDLVGKSEMLSFVFLECINKEDLRTIKDKYVGKTDWRKESATIPVEMKIGGLKVNPKAFFDLWRDQMQDLIKKEAQKIVAEKMSGSLQKLSEKFSSMQQVVEEWEEDINWQVKTL